MAIKRPDAGRETAPGMLPVMPVEMTETRDPMQDRVEVFLPPPIHGEEPVIPIAVNGHWVYVKRGKRMTIPRPHYEVLQNHLAMENREYQLQQKLMSKESWELKDLPV